MRLSGKAWLQRLLQELVIANAADFPIKSYGRIDLRLLAILVRKKDKEILGVVGIFYFTIGRLLDEMKCAILKVVEWCNYDVKAM